AFRRRWEINPIEKYLVVLPESINEVRPMKLWNHYHTPQTVDEAVRLLSQYDGAARIVAGGTDLLVDMRAAGEDPHEALVDITHIPELRNIEAESGSIVIGAGVTHTAIVKSQKVSDGATCLVES